jgi:hypothetical protein
LLIPILCVAGCASAERADHDTDTPLDSSTQDRDASVDAGDHEDAGDVTYTCVWTNSERPETLETLGCPSDHTALAGEPSAAALPPSRSVLFLVERTKDNRVWFFDSIKWRHFTFASEMLEGYEDLSVFNSEMYYVPERRLFLGALTYYLDTNVYAFELAPIDKAPPELISEMFFLIRDHLFRPSDLRYHPTSNALEMENRLPPNVPVITTPELYEGAEYQGLNLGRAVGRIHRVEVSKLGQETLSRMDILVTDGVPNDLPPCAGIVTSEFQTPLSHVNLLSKNRGTPNMAFLNAFSHKDFVSNDGKWVELTVSADGYTVRPSSAEEAEALYESLRPPGPQSPALDLSVTDLTNIEDVDITWTPIVGGKAANFGELANITLALPMPKAFAVPVSRYMEFMSSNGFDDDVASMLDDSAFNEDGAVRKSALLDLRQRMASADIDTALVADIEAKIQAEYEGTRMRFRSSSNAEDLEDFNGAGLYDSYSAELKDAEDTVAAAVKGVWASLWNDGAFEERDWARIDHQTCAMGILVHPSFPDDTEKANGVAITANPFDPPPSGQAAYYINVQQGAVSITNPIEGTVPESFLYYKPPAGGEMTYLSHSNLISGENVLSFDEIVELTGYLDDIHRHFEHIYADRVPFGMDVEFKLMDEDRHIIIKQARPYPF